MTSILNIAYSGLSAFQRALAVTGNNISNASTSGYTRQTAQFQPLPTQKYGGAYIGTGTVVSNVRRNSDFFAVEQVRATTTTKTQYQVFYDQASQIDRLLSQEGTSVSTSMQNFFNSLGQLNDAPDSLSSRNVALKQSTLLVNQFNNLQQKLDEYQHSSTRQLKEAVSQVNDLSKSIAKINERIMVTPNAPDLLDQRDELLRGLSEFIDVSVTSNNDGTINVGIASGESLVISTEARQLAIASVQNDLAGTRISIGNANSQVDITEGLDTGMIGALLDYEDRVIAPTSQLLGQMAIGLAQTFNEQHRLGMDINNQIGKDFFTDFNASDLQMKRSYSSTSNTGTAVLSVAIDDIAQTKLSDYELTVTDTGTNEIRLVRKSDGQATVLNWTDTPPAPPAGQFQIDGLTVNVDDISNLNDGDFFTLSPTRGAAKDLSVLITDSRELALASPVRTQSSLANTGTGDILLGDVYNTTDVNKSFRIEFISDTQYNLVNVTDSITTGPMAFTPGSDNTIDIPDSINPSYSVTVSGIPKTGDVFTADYNTDGFGDNSNGLKLSAIQQGKIFSGNNENIFERYSGLIADVGSKTYQAQLRSEAADVLYKQAVDYRESKSGVNLDEEGANLLRLQQAYQAAGQLMAVSSNLMDILFDTMR